MKKTSLEAYALFVCLVCLAALGVSIPKLIFEVVQIVNPEFTIYSGSYREHQSNDAYWSSVVERARFSEVPKKLRPAEDELTKQRNENWRLLLLEEARDGKKGAFNSILIILMASVFYFIHWRLAKRAGKETKA